MKQSSGKGTPVTNRAVKGTKVVVGSTSSTSLGTSGNAKKQPKR